MNCKPARPFLALVATLAFTAAVVAASHDHARPAPEPGAPGESSAKAGRLDAPTEKDAAWLAKARAKYPLKTCVVSKEELGAMGEGSEFTYRLDGQPDRLVRFCCDSCVDDFKKDPPKYLALLDEIEGKAVEKK
jgi:hypothetical protein